MSNVLIVLLIVNTLLIVILINYVKKNKKAQNNINEEIILKFLDAKLDNQNKLINNTTTIQNKSINEHIKQLDSNFIKTNNETKSIIRHLFQDIDDKQIKQNKKLEEKTLQFENQLMKILQIDTSIEELEQQIKDLSSILNNNKTRGTFGEVQLYQLIQNQFGYNNELIKKQDKLSNGTIVDLSLKNIAMNKKVCIDSKFPLTNFIDYQETNEIGFKTLFEKDIKKHIDDISSKYIIQGETLNFAIMFIPSEAIYMFIMENIKLVEYSYKQKVWLTSPTTLLAIVTMLENITLDYKRIENTELIESELAKLSVEFERFAKRYNNLSKHIGQVVLDFEEISTTQQKISKRFDALNKMEIRGVQDE